MANVIKHKRGSGSDPAANNLVLGELAIRTDTGKLFTKMDSGAIAEIAGGGSDIAINTLSSSSATGGGSATFNGSAYRFTLSAPPNVSAAQLLVSINGVIQKPVAGTGQPSEGFSVDGTDIILGDAPATGSDFFILTFKSLGVSEPADNSVTSAKIADGAIVNADINASAAIARTKLANVDVVDDTSPQLGGDLDTNDNAIRCSDSNGTNNQITFGDSNDLQIRHQSNSSYITNATGNLNIGSNNQVRIKGGNDVAESMAIFKDNGSVELYHDNSKKFETTSTGIDVTGAITADDLRTDNSQTLFLTSASDFRFRGTGGSDRMRIDSSGNVGIGTTSPDALLDVVNTGGAAEIIVSSSTQPRLMLKTSGTTAECRVDFGDSGDSSRGAIGYNHSDDALKFYTTGVANERMRIDSSGRVGINQTSFATSDTMLSISETSGHCEIGIISKNDSGAVINMGDPDSYNQGRIKYDNSDNSLTFRTSASDALSIDSSGNVGIGAGSPAGKLHISSGTSGDCKLIIEADTDNNDENDNPLIIFRQDGGLEESAIGMGFTSTASDNLLTIANSVTNGGISFATGTTNGYTNAVERVRIDTSGNLGIGTTSPVNNSGYGGFSLNGSSGSIASLMFNGTEKLRLFGHTNPSIQYAGDLTFFSGVSGGTERMRVLAGGGLTFNGDTSANNALDDYEEGTFTPAFSNGLVFSTYATNGQRGVYTKIGRFVYGTIRLDGSAVSVQNTNQIKISGLPFASANFSNGEQVGGADPFFQDGFFNANDFSGIVNNNSSVIQLVRRSDGTSLTGTSVNGGRQIRVSFWYMTA